MRFDLHIFLMSSMVDTSYVIEYTNNPIHTVCTEYLVFLVTKFDKDGMSYYWCPYCHMSKNNWSKQQHSKTLVDANLWIDELTEGKQLEYNGTKDQNSNVNDILGVKKKML